MKINFKKLTNVLLLLLSAAVCFITAGCGEENEKPVLKMVTEATFPPYEFYRGKNVVGIDPDIVRYIAGKHNYRLVIEDMNFNSIIAAVQTGKADLAASGITVTEERKKMVNFTIPYVTASQVILTRKKSGITHRGQLKNFRIGVQHGTTGDNFVASKIKEPERYESAALTVAALTAGKVDAVVLDGGPADEFLRDNPELMKISEPLTLENYAFAINKNNPELLAKFNQTLKEMKEDGTLQKIIDSYKKGKSGKNEAASTASVNSGWENFKQKLRINFLDNDRYIYLLRGFGITLIIALGAVVLGILIGFAVAVIRSAADQTGKLRVLNFCCKVYLTVIRGTPVVVQLLIIYFVIFASFDVDKVLVAVLAFGLNSGAYVAEIIRSGINSIDRGQLEAGRSLGLSYSRTMIHVIMPQALKNVLPALGNEFIVLLKETSVSGYIALQDLTKGGDIIRSQTYNAFMPLVAVALIYLAVVMLFSKLLAVLEERLKKNE